MSETIISNKGNEAVGPSEAEQRAERTSRQINNMARKLVARAVKIGPEAEFYPGHSYVHVREGGIKVHYPDVPHRHDPRTLVITDNGESGVVVSEKTVGAADLIDFTDGEVNTMPGNTKAYFHNRPRTSERLLRRDVARMTRRAKNQLDKIEELRNDGPN